MDKLNKFIKEHIYVILVSLLIVIAIILLIVLIKDELIVLLSILFLLILLILASQINIKDSYKNSNIIKEETKKDNFIIPSKPIKEEKDKKQELINIKENNNKKEKLDEKEKLKKELKEEVKKEFLKEQKEKENNKPKEEKHNLIDNIKKETTNNNNFDIKEDKNSKNIKEIIKDNEIIKEIENKIKPNKIENLDVNNGTKKRIAENNIKKEKASDKESLKVTPTAVVPAFITNFTNKKSIKITEEEKLVAAYIQDLIYKDNPKEILDFYKDEEGYINVHLNTDFLKFKIDKNEKYFLVPSNIKVSLKVKPHKEKDKNKVLFDNILDLDSINEYIKDEYNKDKLKEKVMPKNGKHFKLHPIEVKEIINREKERIKKRRINKKIEYYISVADRYHKEHKYDSEIAILNSAIESLKDKDIDLYLLKRKLNIAYESKLKEEKKKVKVKEKKMNNI